MMTTSNIEHTQVAIRTALVEQSQRSIPKESGHYVAEWTHPMKPSNIPISVAVVIDEAKRLFIGGDGFESLEALLYVALEG